MKIVNVKVGTKILKLTNLSKYIRFVRNKKGNKILLLQPRSSLIFDAYYHAWSFKDVKFKMSDNIHVEMLT